MINGHHNDFFDLIINVLNKGGGVAYPTEAVFGLGCDPDNEHAVTHLLHLKKRPVDKGLILIAADFSQLEPYLDVDVLNEKQKEQMFASWPGPVTWVVPARPETPGWLTGRFSSLAVRVSDHPQVQQLCQRFGKPLVSTSANITGLPPCRTSAEVIKQFGKAITVLTGETGGRNYPSQIRDVLTGNLIRQG